MVVHPEVGKWLIGAGEALFGMDPFGWRIASAVVGSLMILVMVRTARRMTGSTLLGVAAGLIMCFDGLHLVLSRLALLDIFQAFFVLCAVSCLVADRDWGRERLARLAPGGVGGDSWGPVHGMLFRPWRVLAGVWFGLGLGTKWSTVFVIAAFGLLVWAWDAGARRRLGVRGSVMKAAVVDALPAFGWLVLLPAVIYVATWTGWLLHADAYEKSLSDTQYGPYWGNYLKRPAHGFLEHAVRALRSLWHYHHDVYSFHTGKDLAGSTHVYQSNPGGWLILNRPVGVDAQLGIKPGVQGCDAPAGSTCLRQVLLLGNPAVWWGGTLAFLYAIGAWVGRRDWRYGVVVVGVLVTWLPWLRYDDRPIFSYYAIVIEPFLVLGADPAAGADPRSCRRVVPEETGGGDRRRRLPGHGACAVRLVLADLDRPADHDAALAAADLVPSLDLTRRSRRTDGLEPGPEYDEPAGSSGRGAWPTGLGMASWSGGSVSLGAGRGAQQEQYVRVTRGDQKVCKLKHSGLCDCIFVQLGPPGAFPPYGFTRRAGGPESMRVTLGVTRIDGFQARRWFRARRAGPAPWSICGPVRVAVRTIRR